MPVGNTQSGTNTIYAAELDQRDGLNKLRSDYYKSTISPVLNRHRDATRVRDGPELSRVNRDVKQLSLPGAPFAGMARHIFRKKKLL